MTAMTQAGLVLGTAAYMSPEQARGKPIDKRTDIWAFGCVLYEMLAGKPAFDGEGITDILAAVVRNDPDWTRLPSDTPPAIRRLLKQALQKDRKQRTPDIAVARLEIADALSSSSESAAPTLAAQASSSPSSRSRRQTWQLVAAAAIGMVLAAGITWMLKPSPASERPVVTRSVLATQPFDRRPPPRAGESRGLVRPPRPALALSPDGAVLVVRVAEGGSRLYRRPLDQLTMTAIPGTEGAEVPFFSPDGRWLGFVHGTELKKMPVGGGPASVICKIPGPAPAVVGVDWGPGDLIVFATNQGLWRVSGGGGEPQQITKLASEVAHRLPHILPGGDAVIFTIVKEIFRWDNTQIVVRSLNSDEQRVLIDGGSDGRYLPSGHLVFARDGTLMAAPFDLETRSVTGGAVALIDNVMHSVNTSNGAFDTGAMQAVFGAQGTIVYATGGPVPAMPLALASVDRRGNAETLASEPREYFAPRVSPDGQRVAMTTHRDGRRVWVYDVIRRSLRPFTPADQRVVWSIWGPDSDRIAFSNLTSGEISWKASGDGKIEAFGTGLAGSVSSWSSDGRLLAYVNATNDIFVVDLSRSDRTPHAVVESPANERFPEFSPDGKWLAFTSNESEREEVFIQPYPGPGPRIQVSTTGGVSPAWSRDQKELFFLLPGPRPVMMSAAISALAQGLNVGTPRYLFDGEFVLTGPVRGYDVSPDGQRFFMIQALPPKPEPPTELVIVNNWFAELESRVPRTAGK
jgi:Tol biopolymer transport system component